MSKLWLDKEAEAWRSLHQEIEQTFFDDTGSFIGDNLDDFCKICNQLISDQIYKNAFAAPDHISLDDAYTSMIRAGESFAAPWLAAYSGKLSPEDRYWITVDAYTTAPYKSIPKKWIIALLKMRPANYLKDLDRDLLDIDPITVYRGGIGTPQTVINDLSWTTDLDTAIFFFDKKSSSPNRAHLWQATLAKSKIIAANNGRDEHEVLQYRSVRHVHEIALSQTEIDAALERHQEIAMSALLTSYSSSTSSSSSSPSSSS